MVKKFLILAGLFLAFLLLSGAAPDDYYSRVERLLTGLNTVVLQANVLPIITGALDEAHKNPRDPYYQNIIVLADAKENQAWRTYENSRKQTRTYTAAQLVDQTLSRTSEGQSKYFYDEISGAKYAQEDRRKARENFFVNYSAQTRGAAGYLENIMIAPAHCLEQFFTLEIPDLPDPRNAGFRLPPLKVLPLGRQVSRLESKDFQWKLKVEPVYGIKRRVNENTIVPEYDFGVGLQIISPEGTIIKTKAQLDKITPFVAIVPLPESSAQRINFKQVKTINETNVLSFADEPVQSVPGKPMLVNYTLPKDIQVVEFSVNDALGRPVYVKKESLPDPRNPLPFAWTPDKRSGEYYVELKGYDSQNKIRKTEPKLLRLADTAREMNYTPVVNRQSGDYYSLVDFSALSATQGLNKIYFWLYGTEDSSGLPVAGSLYVTFSTFAPENSSLLAPSSEVKRGQKQRIRVQLFDKRNEPLAGARVEFFSVRNQKKIIDKFSQNSILTNAQGEAAVDFSSDIPGEAEIYALSDQVWVNTKPLIIKVRD